MGAIDEAPSQVMPGVLLPQAALALDVGDEVGGGDGGADFELGSLWSFAFDVGQEALQVWGLGRLFVHGQDFGEHRLGN